ncbi:MAG TPA: hypothetical protein VJZ68_00075 [Nitrososphaera sp.]|nr:hypothetical protein [Nitrososphaera sp.]
MTSHAPLPVVGIICMNTISTFQGHCAFAHIFSGDGSASFLALVESINVELDLVQSNLASNVTLAEEHAARAHEHLGEDIIEETSERNERLGKDLPTALEDLHDSVANSTTQQIQAKVQNIDDLLGEAVTVRIDSERLGMYPSNNPVKYASSNSF